MEELFPIIKSCPLFDGIAEADMGAMLACLGAKKLSAPKGQVLFAEGDPAAYVGIVLTGSVHLVREDYYGNRSIMAHIPPGEVFGTTKIKTAAFEQTGQHFEIFLHRKACSTGYINVKVRRNRRAFFLMISLWG